MAAVQTLEIVYGLFQNMKEVMNSKQTHYACHPLGVEYHFL